MRQSIATYEYDCTRKSSTIVLARGSNKVGTYVPMGAMLLLSRIDERVKALRISERKALLNAGLDLATIRRIRSRNQVPSPQILAKLEAALQAPPGYLIEAVTERAAPARRIELETVYVRGAVQAGVWREAIEWDPGEWFPVTVPVDRLRPGLRRFGLLVRGNSMNRLYPDGTVVIVVKFAELGRPPRTGDRVLVLRRSSSEDVFEATLKEYELDAQGRHVLWPRSSDPEFQTPIILSGRDAPVSNGDESVPPTTFASLLSHDAGEADLRISALVVGSYRPEQIDM